MYFNSDPHLSQATTKKNEEKKEKTNQFEKSTIHIHTEAYANNTHKR